MPDLEDGSTETDPFPSLPLDAGALRDILDARLAEIPDWHGDDEPVRLGFAMTAPHPLALLGHEQFVARNANNVGVHTRFGDGVRGTRRLEREAVLALGGLLHADSVDGYLTGGANEGTLAGLRIGRNALRAGGATRVVVLTSDLAHHSVAKAAEILDLEIVTRPVGLSWVWDAESVASALDELAAQDKAAGDGNHRTGVIVVTTAGYYNTGSVDPIDEIAALLGRRVADGTGPASFHHVDAAHGGMILPFTAPATPFDFRNPHVHSMVLDPHKSGLMPYSCGVFLCRKGLLGHGAVAAPMSGFIDETITGSRSGAMAAALWSLVFGVAAEGYRKTFRRCLELRDELAEAVRAVDPGALTKPSPGNTVLVVGFSADDGRLPRELTERYRLVGNRLPWRAEDGRIVDRLFHHFYAMPHMTSAHIEGFAGHLATALSRPVPAAPAVQPRRAADEEPPRPAGEPGAAPAELRSLRSSSACLRHLVVHPPQRRDPDDYPHAYSFHTFRSRAELGEQVQSRPWGDDGAGNGLHVYAPDLDRPFANELFGVVSPEQWSLEVLDRHQQKLSLVGAAHFAHFGPARTPDIPVVLANFHADGSFRSAEYKYGDRWHNDEIQVFATGVVVKIGKDARSVRRQGDDYSFSLDTSFEMRLTLSDDAEPPRIVRTARHADPALPRRRHLLRGQYRRFPNRFFDTVVELSVGVHHRSAVPAKLLLENTGPLLARSAELGLVRVEPSLTDGVLRVDLAEVGGARTLTTEIPLALGARLGALLRGIPVGEPESLVPADVVAWAERLGPLAARLREAGATRGGLRLLAVGDTAVGPT